MHIWPGRCQELATTLNAVPGGGIGVVLVWFLCGGLRSERIR